MAHLSVIQIRKTPLPDDDSAFTAEIRPQQMPGASDEELASGVAGGETAALEALLSRYWQPLVQAMSRFLDDRASAEDVVQETFVRVWSGRIESGSGTVRAYLYRVARNLAIDELRRRSARSKRELEHGPANLQFPLSPAEILNQEDVRLAVNEALQALPERRREAFTLVYLRALTYAEVSEIMGVSPKTVGNHISGALSDLRESLQSILEDVGRRED